MKWERIQGDWKRFVPAAQVKWGRLTGEQLEAMAGCRKQLAAGIQRAYGLTYEASVRQIDRWQRDRTAIQGDDERGERLAGPQDSCLPHVTERGSS